jgi:hypothetical protein
LADLTGLGLPIPFVNSNPWITGNATSTPSQSIIPTAVESVILEHIIIDIPREPIIGSGFLSVVFEPTVRLSFWPCDDRYDDVAQVDSQGQGFCIELMTVGYHPINHPILIEKEPSPVGDSLDLRIKLVKPIEIKHSDTYKLQPIEVSAGEWLRDHLSIMDVNEVAGLGPTFLILNEDYDMSYTLHCRKLEDDTCSLYYERYRDPP